MKSPGRRTCRARPTTGAARYAPDENLDSADRIAEKYRGIRPAPGYPACPEHDLKIDIWKLLDVENQIGVRLTETLALNPGESIDGFYFSHPESSYFGVGQKGEDQIESLELRNQLAKQLRKETKQLGRNA